MKNKMIYDPLYGFIHLTPLEWEIIHTPFYQRLKWIKQVGFSFYTFPGAEHSRFGHSIGVMFNAHKILNSINEGVGDDELFDSGYDSDEKRFHQSIRLAALLHDLGTFCFSHTTEMAYIRFGETTNAKNSKGHPDDHEHLGSWIIKNTDSPGGITHLLKKYKISPQLISDLVKGVSPSLLANQILHSEIDCDRMDYLLRDAHYTGLNYGAYDRDYLLHHFTKAVVGNEKILAIRHNALHCAEDFLNARFSWYSQVVRSSRGAKFDALAEELTFFFLEKGKIYSYGKLLELAAENPIEFYRFNDHYFMGLIHEHYTSGYLDKYPKYKEIAECLLFSKSPRTIRCEEFAQRILSQDEEHVYDKAYKKAQEKAEQIREVLASKGDKHHWIVEDIPKRSIIFVKSKKQIVKMNSHPNVLHTRDPAKILQENGDVSLLVDVQKSIISKLQNIHNFIPNVYCSEDTYQLLKSEGIITE